MQEFSGEVKLIGVIFLLRRMNEKAVNSGGGKRKKIRRVNFLVERGSKRRQEEARGSKRRQEEARGSKRIFGLRLSLGFLLLPIASSCFLFELSLLTVHCSLIGGYWLPA